MKIKKCFFALHFAHLFVILHKIYSLNMKKLLFFAIAAIALTSCQKSIDERAAQEAADYTLKCCPTHVYNYTRTDSLTFDKSTHTFVYHSTLSGPMDNDSIIAQKQSMIREALVKEVRQSTNLKVYKDAGMGFRYVLRSASNPKKVLFTTDITPEDYESM